MAENVCKGECIKCSFQQQIYCAAQHCHAIMNNQKAIVERLDRLEAGIAVIARPQALVNPIGEPQAQKADGAAE